MANRLRADRCFRAAGFGWRREQRASALEPLLAVNRKAKDRAKRGEERMNKLSPDNPDPLRHRPEKPIIDHLVDRELDVDPEESEQSPMTDSGASVEEQVRKEWDPQKGGGLPVF